MKQLFYIIVLFIAFPGIVFAENLSGWVIQEDKAVFYSGNKPVFNPGNSFEKSLVNFDLVLIGAEYYLKTGNHEKLDKLLDFLEQSEIEEFKFAIALINSVRINFYSDHKNEDRETPEVQQQITDKKNRLIFNQTLKLVNDKKRPVYLPHDFRDISCNRKESSYKLCRLLKLKYYLDRLEFPDRQRTPVDYINLSRILAPFLEEENLNYIYFIDELMPDLPQKLAAAGFADAAASFQKMTGVPFEIEGADTQGSINLAWYYMLGNDLKAAEQVYRTNINNFGEEDQLFKNRIYLLLAANLYLQGQYEKSLTEILNIQTSSWSNDTINPFTHDKINIQDLKDLSAYILFLAQGPKKAASALNLAKFHTLTEHDQYLQLRLAQILSGNNPELAAKVAEDIIYYAQSRKWKNTEYLATLMHGYLQIALKNYFTAIIDFTKSDSIKGSDKFNSDWIRLSGMMTAYRLSGPKTPVGNIIPALHKMYEEKIIPDNFLAITHYTPADYSADGVAGIIADYYIQKKQSKDLFLLLAGRETRNKKKVNHGILQIHSVTDNQTIYSGFKDYSETYEKLKESARLEKQNLNRDETPEALKKGIESVKLPLVSIFSINNKKVLIVAEPGRRGTAVRHYVYDSANELEKNLGYTLKPYFHQKQPVQIYLNPDGVGVYHQLQGKLPVSLFARFIHMNQTPKTVPLQKTAPPCPGNIDQNNGILTLKKSYFTGNRITSFNDKLHILTMPFEKTAPSGFRFKCDKTTINLDRLARRADYRTIPDSILLGTGILTQKDGIEFLNFWMDLGVNTAYSVQNHASIDKFHSEIKTNIPDYRILADKSTHNAIIIVTNKFY